MAVPESKAKSTVSARGLSDSDSEVLGWDSDRALDAHSLLSFLFGVVLLFSDVVEESSADGFNFLDLLVSDGDLELAELFLLLLISLISFLIVH